MTDEMKKKKKFGRSSDELMKINEDYDGCKQLSYNDLSKYNSHCEFFAVNKMLSVLIFLMVK